MIGGVMRRLALAFLIAAPLLFVLASSPVVAAEWCDTDPLVLIKTPGGTLVPVFVSSGALGAEHLPAVLLASIDYSTQAIAGGGATRVHLDVTVPDDLLGWHFPTRTVASTGPLATGTIYASATGYSGRTMTLTFTLDVP
jgi:hypothetical protein